MANAAPTHPSDEESPLGRRTYVWPSPSPAAFAILVVHARRDVIVQLTGDLDGDGIEALARCLQTAIDEQPRQVVVDLASLDAIDALGVECLRVASRRARSVGTHLILDSVPDVASAALVCVGALDELRTR